VAATSPAPDRPTADLVAAARDGDRDAFGALVVRYEARARAVALAAGVEPASVEDVAQEAFVAAFGALRTLASPAAFAGWLAGIARHRALSWRRRRGLEPIASDGLDRVPDADPALDPGEAAGRESVRETVRQELLRLDERTRLALALKHHAGLTYAEIAETMDLPITTIKGFLDRGTRRLRERLASAGAGDRPR
jgi:RNA polymerase sigma-70 factor (ECF subfamily)